MSTTTATPAATPQSVLAARAGMSAPASAGVDPALSLPHIPNPLDVPKDLLHLFGKASGSVAGDLTQAVWKLAAPFIVTSIFVIGGISLVVVGLSIAAKPITAPIAQTINETGEKAANVASTAAMAAA